MKYFSILILFLMTGHAHLCAQDIVEDEVRQTIEGLIDDYNKARDNQDTVLLKQILTDDVDQLVSSGEWRIGIATAVEGMMRSSTSNPGDRRLIVENVRLLNSGSGIADARYEITNEDGSVRKMWSTFLVVLRDEKWKIAGIRNMLPASPN